MPGRSVTGASWSAIWRAAPRWRGSPAEGNRGYGRGVTHSANTTALLKARDFLLTNRADLDAALAGFRWPAIEGPFCWAIDYFDALGRDNDTLALWIVEEDGSEKKLSYAELVRRSDQVATWLAGHGVTKGSRVMLMLGNRVELWESMLAVMKLGAIVLPTTTALQPEDLADRLKRASVEFVITTAGETGKFAGLPSVRGICVDDAVEGWLDYRSTLTVEPQTFAAVTVATDPLLLYFTSGTTSRPKLVEHTQISYPVGHLSTMYWIGAKPGDVHLTVASPGWAKHAWSCFFAPFLAQATVFIYNYSRFDAAAMLTVIRDAGVTTFCAPPTVWRMLIQADLSGGPGALREVLAAGEPLNPEVITQIESAWGLTVRDGFGQTETTLQIGNTPGQPVVPGAMGRPLPGIPAVLIDPITAADADEGELCLDLSAAPLALMTGYQGDPERAAESVAGGRYHTGDVATRAADGMITYIGRTDDVFKASDYKISPFELESVLVEHPAVVEAAVVPAPDPTRLAVPKAYLTLAAGWAADAATAQAVLQHARDRLAPYLRVRRVEFVADLPKTVSGKIRRIELRAREEALFAGTEEPSGLEWRDEGFTLS